MQESISDPDIINLELEDNNNGYNMANPQAFRKSDNYECMVSKQQTTPSSDSMSPQVHNYLVNLKHNEQNKLNL